MNITDLISEADPQKKIKQLEKLVERQQRMIDRLRKPRIKLAVGATKKAKGKSFLRVICGDSHGAYCDPNAVSSFMADVAMLQPAEVVHLGDAIDCGGFLSSHNVLGVVPELAVTFEQDVSCANDFLDRVQKAVPSAEVILFEGNHENRIARWVCKQVLSNHANASYLLRMFGPEAVLNTEKRGIRYIKRDEYYDGLSVSGTIKLEPFSVAQHGEAYCGQNATANLMKSLGRSVFHGHTHRLQCIYSETIDHSIVGINTGCLAQLRPLYGLTKTTGWQHGYVIEAVSVDHGFLAFPVPIIDGASYLKPLLDSLNIK